MTDEQILDFQRMAERLGDRIAGEVSAIRDEMQTQRYDSQAVSVTNMRTIDPTRYRATIAGHALSALLQRPEVQNPGAAAEMAVQYADALLQRLERGW